MSTNPRDTRGKEYAERLDTLEHRRWKQLFDVQRPYRWNLARLRLGRTLDVGCGIGRNLVNLAGNGVGVDHNAASVAKARARGQDAFTVEGFRASPHAVPGSFDSLLLSHVAEHMSAEEGIGLLQVYLPYVDPRGRLVVITPQEAGYRTDASHVRFVGFDEIHELLRAVGASPERSYSFPFPRPVGRVFAYNEFVVVARLG
jgi:SAM-dependent methyltransferase